MRYMALIYATEGSPEAEAPEVFPAYAAFSEEVNRAGVMRAGDPLQATATATTVRVRNGKTTATDGPFAETREQLGGFYIFDCKDLDEAIAWAAKIPSAKFGSIEVRPIWEM